MDEQHGKIFGMTVQGVRMVSSAVFFCCARLKFLQKTRTASFQNFLSFQLKKTKASESKNTSNTVCHFYKGLTFRSVPRIDGLLQPLVHSTMLNFLEKNIQIIPLLQEETSFTGGTRIY